MPWFAHIVPEQVAALHAELAALRLAVTNLTQELHTMSGNQATMQADLDAIRLALASINADVSAIATDQTAISIRIADLVAALANAGIPPAMQADADAIAADAANAAKALDDARLALDAIANPAQPGPTA